MTCEPCRAGSEPLRGNSSSVTRAGAKRGCSAPLTQNNIPGFGVPALKGNILLCFGLSCMRSSWPWPHSASLSPDFSAGLSPSPSIILSPTAAVIPLSSSLHSSRTALPYLEHLPQCLPSLFPEPRPRAHAPWPGQCSLPHTPSVTSVSPGFMFPQASCSAIPGSSQLFFSQSGTPCYLLVQFFIFPLSQHTARLHTSSSPLPRSRLQLCLCPRHPTHTQGCRFPPAKQLLCSLSHLLPKATPQKK